MNTKATFNVMFLIQKGKLKANGNAPIMARITVNGEMAHFSARMDIKPERWNAKDYRSLGITKEEKKLNALLDEIKSSVIRKYYDFQSAGEVITASRIKMSLFSLNEESYKYLQLCDMFIEDYKKLSTS